MNSIISWVLFGRPPDTVMEVYNDYKFSIFYQISPRIANSFVNYTTGLVNYPVISRLYSHNQCVKVE